MCNFSGSTLSNYALDLPHSGVWREILNTDAQDYGGAGVGNLGMVVAGEDGRASMVLPATSVIWLRYDPQARVPSTIRD